MDSHIINTLKSYIKEIVKISFPSGAHIFLETLIKSICIFFISKISTSHISALGLGIFYISMFYLLSSVCYIGTTVLVSRAFGAGNIVKMNDIFSSMFVTSFFFALIAMFLAYFFCDFYIEWIYLNDEIKDLFLAFVKIGIFIYPAFMLSNVLIAAFSALGDTKKPLFAKIIMIISAPVLNYILIFHCDFFHISAIAGAGIASVLIVYIDLLVLLICLKFLSTPLKLYFRFLFSKVLKAIKIGLGTGFEKISGIIASTIVIKIIANYAMLENIDIMAGFEGGEKIEALCMSFAYGFMVASCSLIGQNMGAGRLNLAYRFVILCVISAVVFVVVESIIVIIFASHIACILLTSKIALEICVIYIIFLSIARPAQIAAFVFIGAFRGSGKTHIPLIVNTISNVFLLIIPLFICTKLNVNMYIVFSILAFEPFCRAFVYFILFKKRIWLGA